MGEKSVKRKGGRDYKALIDKVKTLRRLNQEDYDALVEIITTLRNDDDKKGSGEEKRI
jgi:hypothetical protein